MLKIPLSILFIFSFFNIISQDSNHQNNNQELSDSSVTEWTTPMFNSMPSIKLKNPIKVIESIFNEYIKYDESTDTQENLDLLNLAFNQLKNEKSIPQSDLNLIINFWMYYTVTDFDSRTLAFDVLYINKQAGIDAVYNRISNKKEWEEPNTAPYSELPYLIELLKEKHNIK